MYYMIGIYLFYWRCIRGASNNLSLKLLMPKLHCHSQVRIVLESVGDGVCASPPALDMGFLTLIFSERLLVSLACLTLTGACLFVGRYIWCTPLFMLMFAGEKYYMYKVCLSKTSLVYFQANEFMRVMALTALYRAKSWEIG